MQRRHLLACALAAAFAAGAHADDFPSHPITLVAPFPAGSVTDAVTRVLGKALTQSLGQPVIVENKAGAQGTIGAAYVANAKPDGYTLLIGSSAMFVARSLYKTLPYDPDSFVPVAAVGSTAMMFLVSPGSPVRNIGDLAKVSKKANPPLTLGYGSPSGQVAVALFSAVTDSQPVGVSYRGIPQAVTDMIGGQVQVAVVDIGTGLAQVNGKKARALAISSASRYAGAPEIPTLQEAYPRASGALETIIAVQAPAGTPAAAVQKLDAAIRSAMATTEVKAQFQALNTSVLYLSSRDLGARVKADNPRWESLMKKAGIEPQ
ncbi:tripartite tricarboxylate transporter substrate binding protein [Ramlibacter sp. G-1-2-2]|uniref:Tripartite tricarboxylate transporter substrate binding protein n=1 Tax=Ramlibacter agri TaxID=2728837 RepID=A0A848H157_9BURK|nr:tripartite tricarboxylate transporter substrate binding protein [Ramlibacter agri]NML43362.1 tripartite tricarboxylate transporter substrate binding protein [Ramlibacter agri]